MAKPGSLQGWSDHLRQRWEERARSASRDLFVASHPGWQDPAAWERYARSELQLFLTNIAPDNLGGFDVLEIGCGSGRLALFLTPDVRSYTGFDIAPSMVEAARERCRDLPGARFFHGDGLSVPDPARDRTYDLVIAVAVFIHLPAEVIAANVESAWQVVKPGGQMRFQVLADPDDLTGIETADQSAVVHEEVKAVLHELTDEERRLIGDEHYLGHRFRYDDVEPLMRELTGGKLTLYRGDRAAIYGMIEKV